MKIPTDNIVMQKAWVVNDIEQAANAWSKAINVGPFYLAEYSPKVFSELKYRGKDGTLHMKTAIAYAGDVQIELVEPLGNAPSAFTEVFKNGQTGFHHICYWSDNFEADVEHYLSQGFSVANNGQVVGGGPRFAYIDAFETLGCMIELLERKESTEQTFNTWRDTAKQWTAEQEVIVRL